MSETIRIKAGVECSFTIAKTESVYEVDRAEWEAMSEDEREKTLDDYAQGELENSVNAFAYVLDDED
jgi:UV DNA damage repair endonuclease